MRRWTIAVGVLTALGLATLSGSAHAGARDRIELHSVVFAAKIGTYPRGIPRGTVYGGGIVDRALKDGAIVFSASHGSTKVHTTFRAYFARGSIAGAGTVTLSRTAHGAKFTVTAKIQYGTAAYWDAHGRLSGSGKINRRNMITMNLTGSFSR